MVEDPDVTDWDAASRYVGQVFVRHLNGEWVEDDNTGRPNVLVDRGPWHDVMLSVSSTPHRRTGNRLRTLAEHNLEVIESGGFEKYFKERGILYRGSGTVRR